MAPPETDGGVGYEPPTLDRVERRFWRQIWQSVPAAVAVEHCIELRDFGPLQATVIGDLPRLGMLNLVLGATEPGAGEDDLAAAIEWASERGVSPYVPVTPGLTETAAAEAQLAASGFSPGPAWMKFVRDVHPPRFSSPKDVEVVELDIGETGSFGMIAATGFGLPTWASALFADLPGSEGWHCYVARIDGTPQACGAMLVDGAVAELGIGATLEPAQRRGCQLALLHRQIGDASEAGCQTLFAEAGERDEDLPAGSYRNLLRAGFKEAYLRPNWRQGLPSTSKEQGNSREEIG